jgi:hypothetical protein
VSDETPREDLTRMAYELTNFPRSLEAISDAIAKAASEPVADPREWPAMITRHLGAERMRVDAFALEATFLGIVGMMAQISGETPREIYDAYFKSAPPDEWWRRRLEQHGL